MCIRDRMKFTCSIICLMILVISALGQESLNWVKCVQDSVILLEDVKQLTKDAQNKNIQAILKDLNKIQQALDKLKTDCEITWENTDVEPTILEAQLIIQLTRKVLVNSVLHQQSQLNQNAKQLYQIISSQKNWLIPLLEQQDNTDWKQCYSDDNTLQQNILQINYDLNSKNITGIQSDLNVIQQNVNSISVDCGVNITSIRLHVESWDDCVGDIVQLTSEQGAISSDIQHFDIQNLADDIEEMNYWISQATNQCQSQSGMN
eukprot:TRINITY_DN226_c0_g1_i3.p1 TRINITY_DN226_c0_g1~~TRINITY_DN226_c0_g1_i3.p1  ORF type:complete len:262 (+),score=37.24 TRINITY_DN226_c0_g1_i3:77-862(+)